MQSVNCLEHLYASEIESLYKAVTCSCEGKESDQQTMSWRPHQLFCIECQQWFKLTKCNDACGRKSEDGDCLECLKLCKVDGCPCRKKPDAMHERLDAQDTPKTRRKRGRSESTALNVHLVTWETSSDSRITDEEREHLVSALLGVRKKSYEPSEIDIRDRIVPELVALLSQYRSDSRLLDMIPSWNEERGNMELLITALEMAIETGSRADLTRLADLLGPKGVDRSTHQKIWYALARNGNYLPREVLDDLNRTGKQLSEQELEAYLGPYRSDRQGLIDQVRSGIYSLSSPNPGDLNLLLFAAKSAHEHYFANKQGKKGRPPMRGRLDFVRRVAAKLKGYGYKVYLTRSGSSTNGRRKTSKFERVLEILLVVQPDSARDIARDGLATGI